MMSTSKLVTSQEIKKRKKLKLSHEATMELVKKSQDGDMEAREKLMIANERLIWHVTKRFLNRGYDQEELFQIGAIGLLKAIDKFDTAYTVKFSTYAVPTIIGELQRFMRDVGGPVKVSRSIKELAAKCRAAKAELFVKLQRTPTQQEVADAVGVPLIDVNEALLSSVNNVSSIHETAYANVDGSEPITLEEQIANTDNIDWMEQIILREGIATLDARSQDLVNRRYFLDQTQSEVAAVYGLSQVQISRLEKAAIKQIRTAVAADKEEENKVMARPKKGDHEKALKLIKETKMSAPEIVKETGVPIGTVNRYAATHRSPEVRKEIQAKGAQKSRTTKRAKSKATKAKKEVAPSSGLTDATLKKMVDIATTQASKAINTLEPSFTPKEVPSVDVQTLPGEVGCTVVEFNFDLKMSGHQVDKQEVVGKLQEASNLLDFVDTDKVSFKFNVKN